MVTLTIAARDLLEPDWVRNTKHTRTTGNLKVAWHGQAMGAKEKMRDNPPGDRPRRIGPWKTTNCG